MSRLTDKLWGWIARFLARPAIAEWIISAAMRTPYLHLPSNEDPSYMARYWVFNPYSRETNKPRFWWCPWSVRVHHIKREDFDRALHDHPWNARTIILAGWYIERRLNPDFEPMLPTTFSNREHILRLRRAGTTARLGFGEYHTIVEVSDGGVYTLFISGKWRGVWGFLVNGVKVPWREYLGLDGHPNKPEPRFVNSPQALELVEARKRQLRMTGHDRDMAGELSAVLSERGNEKRFGGLPVE